MNQPPSGKPLTAEQRQTLEATFTAQRIVELRINPVRGNFDAGHLKEINRRIFQDLPRLGFDDVTPGQYRPPTPASQDWIKRRSLESVGAFSTVAYSSMDKDAQARLDKALRGADPAELGKLKTAEFTQAIGRLYAELDYLHPFRDGNSRTLREFTRELAEASGYTIDWQRFGSTPAGRDVLYIARDRSVNDLALPHLRQVSTTRDVLLSVDQLENNRDLPDLLRDAIRPKRAIAFEKLSEPEALRAHPELAEAFRTMTVAGQYFSTKISGDEEAQRKALEVVRNHVKAKLDQGEITDFRRADTEKERSPVVASQPASHLGNDEGGRSDKGIERDR